MTSVPGRRSGFSSPYSKPQILAWLVLLVTALQFLFFCAPVLPLAAAIPVTIVFFALIAGILYYGGLTQAVDPIDPHLRRFLHQKDPDSEQSDRLPAFYALCNPPCPAEGDPPLPEEPMKHCWLCETAVAEHSMHCKFCNKCVRNFDHHCMWLNTCIGSDNYRSFFITMAMIFVMQLCHMAVQIALAVDLKLGGTTNERAATWFNANAPGALFGVWVGYAALEAASFFLIGQLLWFHLKLQREQLTTYAYIVRESGKKREQLMLERDIDAYRTGAIAKASYEGRKVDAGLLHLGRLCRAAGCTTCDPLAFPQQHRGKAPDGSGALAADEEAGVGGFAAALSSSADVNQPDLSRTTVLQEGESNASEEVGSATAETAGANPGSGLTFVKVAPRAAAAVTATAATAAAIADESESSSPSEFNESNPPGQPHRFPSVRKAVST